jgi:response regulator of citrate/malate metabolism
VKVYLVDDDSDEAELFRDAIASINPSIEFIWFADVMETLEALLKEERQPDILFLDINIPQVSGKQLLKLLRENRLTAGIGVVIYSTSISKKDIEDTSKYNVKAYLEKPEDYQTLCSKLKEFLD